MRPDSVAGGPKEGLQFAPKKRGEGTARHPPPSVVTQASNRQRFLGEVPEPAVDAKIFSDRSDAARP
jgi:hypothetical protein